MTKEDKKEYDKKRYQEKKEIIKERVRKYYKNNRESRLAYQREYDSVYKKNKTHKKKQD